MKTTHVHGCAAGQNWIVILALATAAIQHASRLSAAGPIADRDAVWHRLEKHFQPPAEFAGDFGPYRSPLKFANGTLAKSPEDWARRRAEILAVWQRRLGPWPPLLERPTVKRLESVAKDGFTQHHVHVQISPEGTIADGYLLVPSGKGPFPAVLVPFYEPLTSIGEGAKGRGTHDYGLQLVRRGFVTLSIGTPGSVESVGKDTRELLAKAGAEQRRQPLTVLAYVAANCHTALAQMPEVDPKRIGIIGLSYGGKWSMFASCLYDKFACAVWSDPGIVFNEKDANVNYWEPWYLGYDPKTQRKPGVPSAENPRTGLYKELIESGDDLVDLHALMAPRPVLVSGGIQDPPQNWRALNHLIAVNEVLGQKQRVAMTARPSHVPTPEALELELAFLEYWLKLDNSPTNSARDTIARSSTPAVSAELHWTSSEPLIGPVDRDGDQFFADKDPSFVQHDGRWHLFCTVRGRKRSHQIEYLCFLDWEHVEQAERHMLPLTDNYCCAPSVFYFRPQKKWYLIYQYSDTSQDRSRKPGFSTNGDLGKWREWTKPAPLFSEPGELVKNWIDFWVICDEAKAYLFFTSDDGRMWRSDTKLADFPHGWSKPTLVLQADIFEASHTYRLHGRQQYLTIIEAIGPNGRRYYKSYSAQTLDGKWEPEAATWERPFAGLRNVTSARRHWADSLSHGELFRLGTDERMEVDPAHLRLLFQGVSDEQMKDKPYGEIPWRLGILDAAGPE